jgi:endonuclease/exonuclease/phosphatase family metal-dependent hydrolase
MVPKYDFLLLVLQALQKEGFFYTPIAVNRDLNRSAPCDMNGNFVEFQDRHAVLLRVGPNPSKVRPYDAQAKTFTTLYEVGSPLMGTVNVPRSWIAVDALLDDRKFRFVETHIESLEETVQVAQNNELIAALANVGFPIIMVGDFNSNANRRPEVEDYTRTYPDLIAAGFTDAWAAVNSGDPGNTCCHAPDLRNIAAELNRRLDLVLLRGAITPISAKLVAAEPAARTASGVWPTDHAGVFAKLRLE